MVNAKGQVLPYSSDDSGSVTLAIAAVMTEVHRAVVAARQRREWQLQGLEATRGLWLFAGSSQQRLPVQTASCGAAESGRFPGDVVPPSSGPAADLAAVR